jgi:hypothetical protein
MEDDVDTVVVGERLLMQGCRSLIMNGASMAEDGSS